ncbi:MAG: CBS domain-containing protein [Candidatus Tectomicrobia bacterium]|uniref:CBS domain-containing protein n=1 Tax=Tectimicrobiota bacterium TaxID=2528274 RepID=A0A937W139_UNCTE|nr:CBS domain-containing protein [Candidatus Tectomicrobia bacterium]
MRTENLAEELAIAEERLREEANGVVHTFRQPLREVTTWPPAIAVHPQATVAEAMRTMIEAQVGSVLVVEDAQVVGIFTERDVLTKVATQPIDAEHTPVHTCMTQQPLTLALDDAFGYTLHAMNLGGYRHVPLVDEAGRPLALVSMRTIIDTLIAAFPQQLLNLPLSPAHERPRTVEGG